MGYETTNSLDALIAGYVAGSLPRPLRAMVGAHLELSPASRPLMRGLEAAAGASLEAVAPAPLSRRDAALEAIFASEGPAVADRPARVARCGTMPAALQDFIGMGMDDIPWRTKMPGFREYDLEDMDGCHVSLFWIKPGRAIPAHTHDGVELALIIDGAFCDSRGRFARGDISIADHSVDHRPVAETERACIGFSVTDGSLRLTGPLHQRLADIIAG